MPIISAGVHLPGTQIGIGLQIAHQTRGEREHDAALNILEADASERTGDKASDHVRGKLDRILDSPSPLDRFGERDDRESGSGQV